MSADFEPWIEPVCALARRAGAAILEVYRQPLEVTTKADDSPVTIADLRAHDVIVAGLTALAPEVPILSEESNGLPYATRSRWSRYWLVDPLDGTREFLKRNDEFTVNIALIDTHAPVFGVVYLPAQDVLYWGGAELGAYRRVGDGAVETLRTRAPAASPLRIVGSRSHGSDALADVLPRLGAHDLIALGSSLKFCAVAAGEADLYPRFGPTSEWDTAAAQAVLEGAGGAVVDSNAQPLRYNTKESILNPQFVAFGDPSRGWADLLFRPASS